MNPGETAREPVWGLSIRLVHWGLAISVGVAWVTHHGPAWLHDASGYAALALACARVCTGILGPKKDRFDRFVTGFRSTLSYAAKIAAGREQRFLGHNPLGGWMILALLSVTAATGLTGWLFTTDAYWGVRWLAVLHSVLADILLLLIALHVAGVAFTSFRQGENLVLAMVHGRKPVTTRRHPERPADP